MKRTLRQRLQDWYNTPLTTSFMWWWFGVTVAVVVLIFVVDSIAA